jgi:hypothetical protein
MGQITLFGDIPSVPRPFQGDLMPFKVSPFCQGSDLRRMEAHEILNGVQKGTPKALVLFADSR